MPAPLASIYALPDYAQLSPTDEISFAAPTQVAADEWQFAPEGDYIYIVAALGVGITTSAAAGNRTYSVLFVGTNGRTLANVPAAAVQGPGASISYLSSPQVATLASVSTSQVMPLPVIPLMAGMQLQMFFSNLQAGDTFPAPMITALRYSTDTTPDTPAPVLTPTPILL